MKRNKCEKKNIEPWKGCKIMENWSREDLDPQEKLGMIFIEKKKMYTKTSVSVLGTTETMDFNHVLFKNHVLRFLLWSIWRNWTQMTQQLANFHSLMVNECVVQGDLPWVFGTLILKRTFVFGERGVLMIV